MTHPLPLLKSSRIHRQSLLLAPWALVALAGLAACGQSSGPAVCSTDSTWQDGDSESPLMHPGGDCIGCHSQGEGPPLSIAGTVMAELDDDTDCNGVSGVTVQITGADGETIELVTNEAGNFYTERTVATPFSAKVIKDGVERAMSTTPSDTNCASCHTAEGANGAPGRILPPDSGS